MKEQEVEWKMTGIINGFNYPLHKRGICYTKDLGNGDRETYKRAIEEKPRVPKASVTK
jgi:hypothetical protein